MNLRTRLLLLGCCFLIFQLGLLYILFEVNLNPRMSSLEQGLVEKNLTRSMESLQRELFHLEHTAQMFASLTLIKRITMDLPLSEERNQRLLQRMTQQELNLLYILDTTNKVLWEKIINLNTLEAYPSSTFLPTLWKGKPNFFKHTSNQSLQAGIYNSFLGPILIVSAPIISSDPKKTIIGTLIAGKLITPEIIQLIQSLSFTDMKLWPLEGATLSKKHQEILNELEQTDSNFLVEKSDHSFQGYIALPDLNDKANLLISATQTRDFSYALKVGLFTFGAVLIILQLLFLGILSWSIRKQFAIPTKELINKLATYSRQPIDLTTHSWNALTPLVQAFSQYIAQHQETFTQQNTVAYRQGIYFARQELFQELQETLRLLVEGLEWIEQKLINLPTDDLERIIAEKKAGEALSLHAHTLIERLEVIDEKLRAYQKETRVRTNELHRRALRNAALLRVRTHSLTTEPITSVKNHP